MSETLIDRIYECALSPGQWPAVLGQMAGIAGARTGFLFVSDGSAIHRWATSTALGQEVQPLVENGWFLRSDRARRLLSSEHAGFLREHDLYREEELVVDPFYRDLLYPRGLGHAAATAVPLPSGDVFMFSLERERKYGPVSDREVVALDGLRPHLARSAMMSLRLLLDQAQVAATVLASIGLPAVVLRSNGTVLAVNALAEALAGVVVWRAHDRVALEDWHADSLLNQALAEQRAGEHAQARSFPVRDLHTERVMVAHVVPIRLSARDLFMQGAAALILMAVEAAAAPPVGLVRLLFDLTAAEARVARQLVAGQTVEEIATRDGVSLNTVRTHVRHVLEKTGCRRQAELVSVLSGITLRR